MGIRRLAPGAYEFDPAYEGDDSEDPKAERMVRMAGLPVATRYSHRFATWVDRGEPAGFTAALALARGQLDPPTLFLYGGHGLGKTHLALAVGWAWALAGRTVAYHQSVGFLDALRDGYRVQQALGPGESSPDSYHTVLTFAKHASLLILDDLGTEKDTEWATERMDDVVDHRYIHRLPLVVTSNTMEVPSRILDRLKEGTVVRLRGESYRGKG